MIEYKDVTQCPVCECNRALLHRRLSEPVWPEGARTFQYLLCECGLVFLSQVPVDMKEYY